MITAVSVCERLLVDDPYLTPTVLLCPHQASHLYPQNGDVNQTKILYIYTLAKRSINSQPGLPRLVAETNI